MSENRPANDFTNLLVTGGGGYVGSALVPALLKKGHNVTVVDTFWYGDDLFGEWDGHPNLSKVKLDIRDSEQVKERLKGIDAVIHLACISNDPSYDLDPELGKSINYDAFIGLAKAAADQGVRRFIYASSSSVYGVKSEKDVKEDAAPDPLTDYSKYKLACEKYLLELGENYEMERVILRPATVCGYARRLRLDLTVNILTIHALVNRKIKIFGGKQLRPNIHIKDMVRAYLALLAAPREKVDRQAFNCGFQNRPVEEIARIVRDTLGDGGIELEYTPTQDNRSYHINSEKIGDTLGFKPEHTIEEAVADIAQAYRAGLIPNPMSEAKYYNIKLMKQLAEGKLADLTL